MEYEVYLHGVRLNILSSGNMCFEMSIGRFGSSKVYVSCERLNRDGRIPLVEVLRHYLETGEKGLYRLNLDTNLVTVG